MLNTRLNSLYPSVSKLLSFGSTGWERTSRKDLERILAEADSILEDSGTTSTDTYTSSQRQDTKPTWTNYPAELYGKSSNKPSFERASGHESLKEQLAKKRNIPPNKRK